MKIPRNRIVYLMSWMMAFLAYSCTSSLYQGAVTYKISRNAFHTQTKITKIYFNEQYIKVPTARYFSLSNNLSSLPGFHAFFIYKWPTGDMLEYKNYLNQYYVVDQAYNLVDSTIKIVPIHGKDKIIRYRCKKAYLITQSQQLTIDRELTTQNDTVTIWYTDKIKAHFTPFFFQNPEAFVLRIEKNELVNDYQWLKNKKAIGEIYIDSTYRYRYTNGDELIDIPQIKSQTIVEALEVKDTTFSFSDLLPIPIDPVLSRDEFYQIVKGISYEQFYPGELFLPYSSLKKDLTTHQKIQSDIPKVIYYWETDHPLLYDNWLALQKVRTIYGSDSIDIITLARRKRPEKKTAQKWISEFPLDAVHILNANNHIEKHSIRLLPVAVVIDTKGKVVESVYSGNGQFEKRLLSALKRTLKIE